MGVVLYMYPGVSVDVPSYFFSPCERAGHVHNIEGEQGGKVLPYCGRTAAVGSPAFALVRAAGVLDSSVCASSRTRRHCEALNLCWHHTGRMLCILFSACTWQSSPRSPAHGPRPCLLSNRCLSNSCSRDVARDVVLCSRRTRASEPKSADVSGTSMYRRKDTRPRQVYLEDEKRNACPMCYASVFF